ncbi:serum response factor-binding protein 1-like [Wyeomyia smithii]|uniref:serum response factor-binding protein 1-like n=1 Tax=Wyeomyia smithii TaxID=174621 RepID=UPI0024681498|nr:serum response factor-binding protein 1-like [Wyeomyia smithii]
MSHPSSGVSTRASVVSRSSSHLSNSMAHLRERQELERQRTEIAMEKRFLQEQQKLLEAAIAAEEERRSRVSYDTSMRKVREWIGDSADLRISAVIQTPEVLAKLRHNPHSTQISFRAEASPVQQPPVQRPSVQQSTVQQLTVQQLTVQQPSVQQLSVQQPSVQQLSVQQPLVQSIMPVMQPTLQPFLQQPVEQPVQSSLGHQPFVQQQFTMQQAFAYPQLPQPSPLVQYPGAVQPRLAPMPTKQNSFVQQPLMQHSSTEPYQELPELEPTISNLSQRESDPVPTQQQLTSRQS